MLMIGLLRLTGSQAEAGAPWEAWGLLSLSQSPITSHVPGRCGQPGKGYLFFISLSAALRIRGP